MDARRAVHSVPPSPRPAIHAPRNLLLPSPRRRASSVPPPRFPCTPPPTPPSARGRSDPTPGATWYSGMAGSSASRAQRPRPSPFPRTSLPSRTVPAVNAVSWRCGCLRMRSASNHPSPGSGDSQPSSQTRRLPSRCAPRPRLPPHMPRERFTDRRTPTSVDGGADRDGAGPSQSA